jgi:archaellum component FlaF (FlaF/FlaG flagellin family)
MRTTVTVDGGRDVRGGLGAHRRRALAAAAGLIGTVLTVGAFAGATPASALGNGDFSVAPTTVGGHSRQNFTPIVAAGTTSTDQVTLANLTKNPITLELYAADAYNTPDGSFAVKPNFEPKVHMGKWIHFAVSSLTIPPLSGDIVPFTYTIPGNTAPGDYAGGVVAVQTTGAPLTHGHVRVRAQYAIAVPVLGRVQGPLHAGLAVSAVSLNTSGGFGTQFGGPVDATVTYSVTNTGNRYLKPTITVTVSGLVGGGHRFSQQLPDVLVPGSTITFRHTFDSVLPFGSVTASVKARTNVTQATGSSTAIVIPWGIVAIVVLLIALIVLLVRRRRRPSHPGPSSELTQSGGGAQPGSGGAKPAAPVGGSGARGP